MKTIPACLIFSLGTLVLAGCTDASTAKRDDGRYVTVPINGVNGAPTRSDDVHHVTAPGETGRQLSPDNAQDETTTVAVESPAEQKWRESQEKFESDLAKLDSK